MSVWQVDHAKSLHYVGAGVAFPAGLLFVCLQCVLTYRVAMTTLDYWMAHFRVALSLGAMISLVLSILQKRLFLKKLLHQQQLVFPLTRSSSRRHLLHP